MDESIEELGEEGKIDLLNPVETGVPEEAAGFSMQSQKDKFLGGGSEQKGIGFSLQRITTTSAKATQDRTNVFLNGASNEYAWNEKIPV